MAVSADQPVSAGNLLAVLGSIAGGVLSAGIYSRYGNSSCNFVGSGFTKSGGNIIAQEAGIYHVRQFAQESQNGDSPIKTSKLTIDSIEIPGSLTLEPVEFLVELDAGDTISASTTAENSNYFATAYISVARVS